MFQKINYFYRKPATGFCFIVFGLGGLLLFLLVFPAVKILFPKPEDHRAKYKFIIHKAFGFFVKIMDGVGIIETEVVGLEKIKEDAGCIVLANHPSLVDVVALIAVYEQASCIVKTGVWNNPFMGGVVKGAGYVNNGDGEQLLQATEEVLSQGSILVIFPEGTRSVPGHPVSLRRGAAQAALRLKRPIRFVHITMEPSTLTKADSWHNVPARKAKLRLVIGDKLLPQDFPDPSLPMSIRARRLTQFIKEKLEMKLIC